MDPVLVDKFMSQTEDMVPSLKENKKDTEAEINPMAEWVDDALEKVRADTGGTYVGFKTQRGSKAEKKKVKRGTLYPIYIARMEGMNLRPVGQKKFIEDLLNTLKLKGWNAYKIKKTYGVYICGVKLRPESFDSDFMYGAPPLESETPQEMTTGLVVHNPTQTSVLETNKTDVSSEKVQLGVKKEEAHIQSVVLQRG